MGKSSLKGNELTSLVERASALQKASRGYRDGAAESARLALDELVLQILRDHLEQVVLRLDPRKSQAWDDFYAVLEVEANSVVLRMPVPKLKSKDSELANRIRTKIVREEEMEATIIAVILVVGGIGFIVKMLRQRDDGNGYDYIGYLGADGKPCDAIGLARFCPTKKEAEAVARAFGYKVEREEMKR
ncbi:MAG: hypothetical protein Q8N65_02730 [bacterium]|nr:hypothetical protein [bacterium]